MLLGFDTLCQLSQRRFVTCYRVISGGVSIPMGSNPRKSPDVLTTRQGLIRAE